MTLALDALSSSLARDLAAALVRRERGPSRQALRTRARLAAKIPAYLANFKLHRGRCRAKGCTSRYGVVRLSIDTRSRERIDRIATLECASCGRTWRRITPPALSEYQSTRLTLILPGEERRWYARGRWHREGDDAVVLPDASQLELMAASDDWRKRNEQLLEARDRVKRRKAAEEAASIAATRATLARLAAIDEERAAEEAAARKREEEYATW